MSFGGPAYEVQIPHKAFKSWYVTALTLRDEILEWFARRNINPNKDVRLIHISDAECYVAFDNPDDAIVFRFFISEWAMQNKELQ